jgi:3alpha(or 20beta)-hydroxysteroid dehydrogenase
VTVLAVAFVTGGARGIGAATARLLSQDFRVVVADVLVEEGRSVAAALGDDAAYAELDVTDPDAWQEALVETERRWEAPSVLVNAAGVLRAGASVLDTPPAVFREVMEVNFMGAVHGLQTLAPAMAHRGGGSIINVSSIGGIIGAPLAAPYVASKWALRGFTKAAAIDLAALGIRVNSVHPGAVATEMLRQRHGGMPEPSDRVPMRRIADPAEIAAGIRFLASPDSSFMTGTELVLDGGMLAN